MKRITLLLILIMLTVMFVGVGTAGADDYSTVGEIPVIVANATQPQDLAGVRIYVPVLRASTAPQHHRLLVSLPSGFALAQAGGALPTASELSGIAGISLNLYELDGTTPLSVQGDGVREFVLEVVNPADAVDAVFFLTLPAVMVGDVSGDVRIGFTALAGDFTGTSSEEGLAVAKRVNTAVDVKAVKTVNLGIETEGEIEVQLQERAGGDLQIGKESIRLRLPAGFVWEPEATAVDVSDNIKNEYLRINYTEDKSSLLLERIGSLSNPATVHIRGAVAVKDADRVTPGDIKIKISGSSKVEPQTLTVGTYEKKKTIVTKFTIGSTLIEKTFGQNAVKLHMDVAPYIKNDRTMIPLRYVGEALDYTVKWNEQTRTATLSNPDNFISIPIDSEHFAVNGGSHKFDAPPEIMEGRTMLSVANIGKALGLEFGKDIIWNPEKQTVFVQIYP